ncbi:unnamed protein product [Phytophthora fragariaefolia]|uniref:Unnamed protein product n=1 Tax=Phytophthora fragariaefolia TaxID=1490495 RepID=A0A9W6XK89_9STRA|nr:unnamed protein product [Phytophthora fragariaefolia]
MPAKRPPENEQVHDRKRRRAGVHDTDNIKLGATLDFHRVDGVLALTTGRGDGSVEADGRSRGEEGRGGANVRQGGENATAVGAESSVAAANDVVVADGIPTVNVIDLTAGDGVGGGRGRGRGRGHGRGRGRRCGRGHSSRGRGRGKRLFDAHIQGSDRRENDGTTNEDLPVGAAVINAVESDDMSEATRGSRRWGSAWWNAENIVEIDISRESGGYDAQLPTGEDNQGLTLNNEHRGDPSISREESATSTPIQTPCMENYQALIRLPDKTSWRNLTENVVDGELCMDSPDELEISSQSTTIYEIYDPERFLPVSLAEVEAVKNLRLVSDAEMNAPTDLYEHEDKSIATRFLPEYQCVFAHSASSIFFATSQSTSGSKSCLRRIREYANYWGPQMENAVFGGSSTSLNNVLSLNRFKLLWRCLSFRSNPDPAVQQDTAARIRPLLNLLKCTGGRYIQVKRDLALDEASIACRSRHGRHIIVFNPHKPGGKYHFRMYVVCCATTSVAMNYRLHCTNSDIADRMMHVVNPEEVQALRIELDEVKQVRRHVLEVVRPYFNSQRIINMDNYYTSVQLLLDLRLKGLYGGTVRGDSKHFPKHTVLQREDSTRGDHQQSVAVDHNMPVTAWCDGNIVTMVSNSDASTTMTVKRRVGNESREFSAPTCILQYNRYM